MRIDELTRKAADGTIDTVLVCMADMQGRLQGKRMAAGHFLDHVAGGAAEACSYQLATDVEMNTVGGYRLTSWERGYGDFELAPDLDSLRPIPWHERTAAVVCDVRRPDGGPVAPSPRQVLRRQIERLAERGWIAQAASELEFIVFEETYEQAWDRRYQNLTGANRYNVDYSILGTSRVEPLIGRIRRAMAGAGLTVEDSKGECNLGQHEINFRYAPVLTACDQHVLFKNGAKEIAAQEGRSLTFMAKFDEREGNSCHLHLSLAGAAGGENVFAADRYVFERFLAGLVAGARELTLLFAPNINSYKRFVAGSFAPTTVGWGEDNRTCAFRVIGHGAGRRIECRIPGGDVNPYLAFAAMIAAGLDGIERALLLPDPVSGDAYTAGGQERVPGTLREARDLFATSATARRAFGEEVVEHYVNAADVELSAFDATVTDWERVRGFERL